MTYDNWKTSNPEWEAERSYARRMLFFLISISIILVVVPEMVARIVEVTQ